jgi:hypothetical protein
MAMCPIAEHITHPNPSGAVPSVQSGQYTRTITQPSVSE